MLDKLLEFKGTWRTYQQRVLDRYDIYSKDNKFHIVAAPGSGKTTLGIELIRRIDRPALILAPSITIRQQWVDRIADAFLNDPSARDRYISQDLKDPRVITVATYQALHSAITRFHGEQTEENDEFKTVELVDYSDFDIVKTFKDNHLGTLCLDECHHLRNEWWKALEDFKPAFPDIFTVSLTATPPYDSEGNMWNRYMSMCGEIDEEITVPELVKAGNLCPHQDYVYFNFPSSEEMKIVNKYEKNAKLLYDKLMVDPEFFAAIRTHRFLKNTASADELLENPAQLSSVLIFLNSHNVPNMDIYKNILCYKTLPPMSVKWMEILLQGFLFDDVDSYDVPENYRENLIKELKASGFIERKKVSLKMNKAVKKLLVNSVGKCESIRQIVRHEYASMQSSLRLLVLTDYIRKEYETALGDASKDILSLGVLPFFELLRRDSVENHPSLRLGVLCGTIVIIPTEAKEALLSLVDDPSKVSFHRAGKLEDYVKVELKGDSHFITGIVTELFSKGYMQVLIGTKSLLGEGWDSPCINSLILASFVGSYMLSNQMRGRAIRVFREVPDKTSNIWHLVCVKPPDASSLSGKDDEGEDYNTLCRRTEHFLGLNYEEDVIENGIDRMTYIKPPFTALSVKKTNRQMLELSSKRELLKERWDRSLAVYDKIEIVKEAAINEKDIPGVIFFDILRLLFIFGLSTILSLILLLLFHNGQSRLSSVLVLLVTLSMASSIFSLLVLFKKLHTFKNPMARLELFGKGILKALHSLGMLESDHSKVQSDMLPPIYSISLKGGTGHDKALFADCVSQFYDSIDNQRYILYNPKRKEHTDGYFAIPDCFSKKKEDALLFAEAMKPYIGKHYIAIYTRNPKGRKILIKGRIHALANKQNRCLKREKVKSALE